MKRCVERVCVHGYMCMCMKLCMERGALVAGIFTVPRGADAARLVGGMSTMVWCMICHVSSRLQ